jgi:hypothetical protein
MTRAFAEHRLAAGRLALPGDLSDRVLVVGAFVSTAGLAAANGGFFPTSWSLASITLLWAAVVAQLIAPLERLQSIEVAFAAAVAGLAAWTWLSILWSADRTQSILEAERILVLVAAVAVVFTLAGRYSVKPLIASVLGAVVVVCSYALLTRLFPERLSSYDPVAGYRLSAPIGYWNGLGVFAAIGFVLGLGVTARAGHTAARIAGASSLVVLLPTLYFTFSRGSWIALGAGLVALIALDPRRLQLTTALLVHAPLPVLAVVAAARSRALTNPHTALADAMQQGHRMAYLLLVFALLQALVARAFHAAEARVEIPTSIRIAYGGTLLTIAALVIVAVFARYGGPLSLMNRGYRAFAAPPPRQTVDLNQRLFNLSGNGRWTLWKVAGQEAKAHPLFGGGAGTYEEYWLQHRPIALDVEDAHNLYAETLAELGLVGLLLLVSVFAIPLVVAVKLRRHPLVPTAAAALTAYAIHAAADWDWELTGVTLAAIILAATCVLAGRELGHPLGTVLGKTQQHTVTALLLLLLLVALVGTLGNIAADKSAAALRAHDWQPAERYAHRAVRWSPWSATGWQDLGEAQLALHQLGPARTSLRTALAKDPRNWMLWLDLAAASRGRARRAAFEQAHTLNPRGSDVALLEALFAAP